jgi:hypothetical protein
MALLISGAYSMGIVFYVLIRIIDSKCMTALDCTKAKTQARLNLQAELNTPPPIVVPPIVVPLAPQYSPHVMLDCPDCSGKNPGS